jgi:hypothetical protein
LLYVADSWTHLDAIFLLSGSNGATLVASSGGVWSVTTSPPGGTASIGWDGSKFNLYNNTGANHYFRISMLGTHASMTQQGF